MGLFSSSSRASTTTTNQNAGFSEIGGAATSINLAGITGKNARVNLQLTDQGAVKSAFDFATNTSRDALRQVELAGATTADTVRQAVTAVSESARAETENIVIQGAKWAALAAFAFAAAWAVRGFKG